MGTTRDALELGSGKWAWCVVIEGYEPILTSHDDAAAVLTAWAGTGRTVVTRGLSVDLDLQQSLDPDEPIADMGTCSLWVTQDGDDDSFGIATHRRGGQRTYLAESLGRTETTVTVKSTTFAPETGTIHIGTEAITYGGKTPTTFTDCERGVFAAAGAAGGNTFARDHTVTDDANNIRIPPEVTLNPKWWEGRFVSVYLHRVVDGVLDVKAEAERVFAGTVGEIRDDQSTGATVVEVRSLMDWLGDRVLGDNLWQGTIEGGVRLDAGQVFKLHEEYSLAGVPQDNLAHDLIVVASGAVGANQVNAGRYALGELCDVLNPWFASELAAGRIDGTYTIASPVTSPAGLRTKIYAKLVGVAGFWNFTMPHAVATFFGFSANTSGSTSTAGHTDLIDHRLVGSPANEPKHVYDPTNEPLSTFIRLDGTVASELGIVTTSGELEDTYTWLPGAVRPASTQIEGVSYSWGLFIIGDEQPVLAAFDPNDPTYLIGIRPWLGAPSLFKAIAQTLAPQSLAINASDSPRIRQIMAFERDVQTALLGMCASTGTPGYNDLFFDALPKSLSVGVPLEWIGNDFASELPGSGESTCIVVEKPTKFSEIIASELVIRFAFLKWERGTLRFGSWRAPTSLLSELDLSETSKAEPADVEASHASTSNQTDQFKKSIVKIVYNRSFAKLDDEYTSYVMFADRVAAEDAGGAAKVHTIEMANTFDELASTGASIEALLPLFMARMPMISRDMWLVERSIDAAKFWKLSVGAIVSFTDTHVRNPTTGTRGITDRPALVMRLGFSPGGELPGSPDAATSMGGRITLMFFDTDPERAGAPYAPSANVDKSANPSGFVNGYNDTDKTLRTVAHAYTNAAEAVDAAQFAAGDEIFIVERDPYDPDNPIMWAREVVSVAGLDVVLDTALSAPAWDPSREYVILYADYEDAQSSQHANTYQADDATGLIQGAGDPYLYGSANADPDADVNDDTEPELPCNRISDDGAGRCVYGDTQLIRLVDNFIDYRSAQRDALLLDTEVANADVATGSGYKLVAFWPVFLSRELLTNAVFRYITVAPWAGSTDGTETKMRVRLCNSRPSVDSLYDFSPPGAYAQAEWTGITNTTLEQLADQATLTVNVKGGLLATVFGGVTGLAWVTLELGYKATTRGIAAWSEGARQAA